MKMIPQGSILAANRLKTSRLKPIFISSDRKEKNGIYFSITERE